MYFVKYLFSLKMHKQSSAQRTESSLSLSLVRALNTKQGHFILFLFPTSSFQEGEGACWSSFKRTIVSVSMPK